jgi:hypothetical protein
LWFALHDGGGISTKHVQSEWGCIIEEASPGIYVTQLGAMLLQP